MTQYDKLARLLSRKTGATAMDIVSTIGTVCPHKRLSELKQRGWTIRKEQVPGRSFHRYFGKAPKA
jgi:hypothetical protein